VRPTPYHRYLNLISAGQGQGIITCPTSPCLHYGGVFMPARLICIHNITPKSSCRMCKNEMARLSNQKHYSKERNQAKYQADRYTQLARIVNRAAREYGASGIVTAEIYSRFLNGPCDYCGLFGLPMELDHRIPMSKGGSNEISNLHGVCRYCNRSKSWFGEAEFLNWLNSVRKSA
jgi:5-methylcytosine-specific restriction endonuclease McrA